MSTYYDILRVPEDADDKEIKAAYRQAALAYHPDHMPKGVSKRMRDDAAEIWLEIQEAFTVLSDRTKREEYDTLLAEMRQGEEAESQFEPAAPPPAPPQPKPSGNPSTQNQTPPAPAPPPPPAKRQSFWGPANTPFGSVALITGGIGCLLFLGGLGDSQTTVLPGLTLVSLSLGSLCWRHGMRPGTDPKILGGSVFLFIFTIMFFAGWLDATRSSGDGKSLPQPATQAAKTSTLPEGELVTVPCKTVNANVCVGVADPAHGSNPMPSAKISQPSVPPQQKRKDPILAAITGADSERVESVTSEPSSSQPKDSASAPKLDATKAWWSMTNGQFYRSRLDRDALYLDSIDQHPSSASNIVSCNFHRAVSMGLSWVGECWERNPRDQSTFKADATISIFSETQIKIATSDINDFNLFSVQRTEPQASLNEGDHPSTHPPNAAPPQGISTPKYAPGSQRPDLSSLSGLERQSIESACSYDKNINGPAAYYGCLENQLRSLARISWRPDFSGLTNLEHQSLESACSYDRSINGPAAYYRCLENQFRSLAAALQQPDLSSLSSLERQSIESACSYDKNINGPAAYYRCVRTQVELLKKRR